MERRVDFREQYRVHVRQQIVDLAHPILAVEGEDAVTMSKLAKLVGLSIGSMYRYFPSRGALLAILWQERIRNATAALTAEADVLSSEPAEALRSLAQGWASSARVDAEAVIKVAEGLERTVEADRGKEAPVTAAVADPLVDALARASRPELEDRDQALWRTAVVLRVIAAVATPPPTGSDDAFVSRTIEALIESWTHRG